ncbi:MAG TPA: SIMPL domain-containing protein [Candidatus Paceibacterota bacterium]|nr:SIMPL domain-containing protein [Candidatus Paceibacterota bacterium]
MIEQFRKEFQVGGWVLIAVFALAGLWLIQNMDYTASVGNRSDTVSFSGTGTVLAKPDVAVAELAISIEGTTAERAQTDANAKSQTVVQFLKDAGISEDDIRTSSYSIYPMYDYIDGRSRIRGYQVTQSLTVKIRDLEKANEILDGVVGAGVNQVNNFQFTIDDPEELEAQAREQAIENAKDKAKALRDDLGIKLGRIVGFSEGTSGSPVPYGRTAADGIGGGGGAPELPTGQNEIEVTVTLTYQIR